MSSPFDAIGGAIDRARGAVGGFIDRRTDGTPLEGAGDSFADVLRPQPPAQERRDGQASNRAGDAGGGNVVQRAANAFDRATNDIPVLEGLGDWAGETLGGESQTPGRVRTELADAASALASGGSPGLAEKSTAAPEGDGESWRLGGLDDFVDGWRNGAARAHRFGVVMDYLSGQHPEMIPPIEPREFDEHTVTGRIGQTIAGVGADLATLPFIPGHERIKASREDSTIAPNTAYWLGMADMAGTVLPPVWSAGTAALTESGRALADREADVGLADAALRGLQAGALSLAFDRVTDGLSGLGGGSGNGGLFGDLLPEPVGVRILDVPDAGAGITNAPEDALVQNVFEARKRKPVSEDPYQRPSGYRQGVRDEVWKAAEDAAPDGKVRDPETGEEMNKDEPWDMGHRPRHEFRYHQENAEARGIDRKKFLDEHNDPSHYRPETPRTNRSHALEEKDSNNSFWSRLFGSDD